MRTWLLAVALSGCTKDAETDSAPPVDSDVIFETDSGLDSGFDSGGWYTGLYFDLSFSGTGHAIGAVWWLGVYDADDLFVDYDQGVVEEDGTIDAYLYGSLVVEQSYRVDLITDADGDRQCDGAPTDPQWQYAVPGVLADVSLTEPFDATFATDPAVCEAWRSWHFDAALAGTGYAPGDAVRFALVDSDLQDVYFTADGVVATDGTIAVSFQDAFAESTPYLDLLWFVDANGTPGCQPLSDATPDPQWARPVYNWSEDVTLTSPYDPAYVDACWAFAP